MTDPGTQRSYRAPCPGCGAPVEFRAAQSTHAVCAYCRGIVVRDGDTLKRAGRMAELFDDFSPLQLAASGRYEQQGFTLVGRLQYGYAQGRWTEWIAAFDDGQRTGILSEDNGAFVFARPAAVQGALPAAAALKVGASATVGGQRYTVASSEQVALVSAQGELPRLPPLNQYFTMVDLRGEQGQVLSLDYSSDPPAAYLGRSVKLGDLALRGLRDESAKTERGRSFNCPRCGAPVAVRLESSRSITCPSCRSLIDISNGIGGELSHASQGLAVQPVIALGSVGQFQGASWQVVGFQHRTGRTDDDEDSFDWDEYLLYNQLGGFCFLVDASDGWSLVAPVTGAPTLLAVAAVYQGKPYRLESSYRAETTYVSGEFYWRVERGETTHNKDFVSGREILSLEVSPHEQVWSHGHRIESRAVASAFKLDPNKGFLNRADVAVLAAGGGLLRGLRADASPTASSKITWVNVVAWIGIIIFVLILSRCDDDSSGSGGSYGSYSSGGGHK